MRSPHTQKVLCGACVAELGHWFALVDVCLQLLFTVKMEEEAKGMGLEMN